MRRIGQEDRSAYELGLALSRALGSHEEAWLHGDKAKSDLFGEQLETIARALTELQAPRKDVCLAMEVSNLWNRTFLIGNHTDWVIAYGAVEAGAAIEAPDGTKERPGERISSFLADVLRRVFAVVEPNGAFDVERLSETIRQRLACMLGESGSSGKADGCAPHAPHRRALASSRMPSSRPQRPSARTWPTSHSTGTPNPWLEAYLAGAPTGGG